MASKKKQKKTAKKKVPKQKLKKPSSGKVRSKGSTSTKRKKSATSKKSSKADTSDFTLVTLDPITRKVTTPKTGKQVFFAWKSRQGKLYPIDSQYSQAYYKTDAEGIKAAFKAGTPLAYNVYKQLTKDVSKVKDKDGNAVTETVTDKKTGSVKTLFRWKVTGRNLRHAQSVAVHSIAGFISPLTRGFVPQVSKEIPQGSYLKVPVTFGKTKRQYFGPIRFTGDSIRDTLKQLLPDVTTADLVRRRIRTLGVDGIIDAYRPENPYAEDTPDFIHRENWAKKIWKDSSVRRFHVGAQVPSLMNFASRVATAFRTAFSSQGLRVTSLVELEDAEERQYALDTGPFRLLDPIWPSIIEQPLSGVRYRLSVPGREGKFVSARKYFSMRYEADGREATDRAGSKYATVLELTLSIKGF